MAALTPDVSIIIPAHNAERYIERSISSALSQTIDNIEVIVVDDASTDNTFNIVKKFADERVKLIRLQSNRGVSAARNQALKVATGKWIALLDSDDWYAPNRLEKLLQTACEQAADIIVDDLYLIRDGEDAPWGTKVNQSGETFDQIRRVSVVDLVASEIYKYGRPALNISIFKPVFRRSFLELHDIQYDESIKIEEDFFIMLICLIHDARMYLLPEPYYYYLIHQNSLSSGSPLPALAVTIPKIKDFCSKNNAYLNWHPDLRSKLSAYLKSLEEKRNYYQIVESLKSKQWTSAVGMIARRPSFLIQILHHIPLIVSRRFNYYVLGNKRIYERLG